MTTILILAEPVATSRVHGWARGAGLSCVEDLPLTGRARTLTFSGERGNVYWVCRSGSVHAVVVVSGTPYTADQQQVLGLTLLESYERVIFTQERAYVYLFNGH